MKLFSDVFKGFFVKHEGSSYARILKACLSKLEGFWSDSLENAGFFVEKGYSDLRCQCLKFFVKFLFFYLVLDVFCEGWISFLVEERVITNQTGE